MTAQWRKGWGLLVLGIGLGWLASAHAAGPLTEAAYKKVVEADIAAIIKLLNDGKPERGATSTIKPLALLLANNARHAGQEGIAAEAVKIAEAASKKDWATANEAAKKLASASGGMAPAQLHTLAKLDLADVMSPFRLAKSGGLNIEKDIRDAKKAGSIAADAAILIGARTAGIAEFTYHFPVDKAASGANAAKWKKYTDQMLEVSKQVVTEASKPKPDTAALGKLMGSLDATCVNCHNDFRD